jgi:hypothetical protein
MQPSNSKAGAVPFPRVPEFVLANWREELNQAGLAEKVRAGYTVAIAGYLDYCLHNGLSVALESARAYMGDAERRQLARNPELWKEGLNWFFRAGHRMSHRGLPGTPSRAVPDSGRTDWERRMIERLRLGHYSWRTEQTYREWAWRFHLFLKGKELETASNHRRGQTAETALLPLGPVAP